MRRLSLTIALAGYLLIAISASPFAQGNHDHLRQHMENLPSDKKVTLTLKTGETEIGKLIEVEFEKSRLTVNRLYASDRAGTTYQFEDLESISFTKPGELSEGWMIGGLVGGALVGISLGYAVTSGDAEDATARNLAVTVGGAVFGGVGFLLGTIIPLITSSETVEYQFSHGR